VSAADVDRYIAQAPEAARPALGKLRQTIRSAAPEAEELISYQIPTFKLEGPLVAYAAWKNHIGFYVMSEAVMQAHKEELAVYEKQKATVRFPTGKPLPAGLVKKLVKARIAENSARADERKKKTTGLSTLRGREQS
jgi:uncharacterized protein YdhG (YjbR/CyaY superfamily)